MLSLVVAHRSLARVAVTAVIMTLMIIALVALSAPSFAGAAVVTPTTPAPAAAALPDTGLNFGPMLFSGMLLLAIGVVAMFRIDRRKA